jgi:chromosome segregation ATPase
MMRYSIVKTILLLLIFGFINLIVAQSDLEIVDNFKSEVASIDNQIKNATSLEELKDVPTRIDSLKENYADHKKLLDNSLYPDNYQTTLDKLNKNYLMRQGDFTTIDVLQTEVSALNEQVEFLNQRNNELLSEVRSLEAQRDKDAKTIKKLNNLVAQLRTSIRERDELVLSMIDSLMPPTVRDQDMLTAEDKSVIAKEEQEQNVIANVKTTIKDNIRFMQVTSLKPNDLIAIREQQEDFSGKWQKVGVELVEVYSEDGKKSEELKEIDELFNQWYAAVAKEAWSSIDDDFSLNGIELRKFNNGEEFTTSIELFIGDELKNLGVKSDEDSKKVFAQFADSTWFAIIQPVWMNYLIENKMLTEENKDRMESKIAEWKNALYPSNLWILFLLIAVVVIGIGVFVFIRKKKPGEAEDTSIIE